jgi:SOS-response transcriptional repressor LexA
MKTTAQPLGKLIRRARNKATPPLTQRELANRAGLSETYLSKLENDAIPNPSFHVVERLAEAAGLSMPSFLGLDAVQLTRKIPFLDWVQAGEWTGINPNPDLEEFIETDLTASRLFALKVKGDSMEPLFREGEVILVNPDIECEPGNYCIAKMDIEDEATLKQLKKIGSVYFLHPLNSNYEDIQLTKKMRIVGKVVRSQKDW